MLRPKRLVIADPDEVMNFKKPKFDDSVMNRTRPKVINDPIHGHFELSSLAVQIIDTPEFQRLRRLKQLGTTFYVFPGAEHTRFSHSLGVYNLARKQAEILKTKQPELGITERDIELVSIAGLCHDLGHGPFSHAFEGWINHRDAPDPEEKLLSASPQFCHEDMSLSLLRLIVMKYSLPISEEELVFISCCISDKLQLRLTASNQSPLSSSSTTATAFESQAQSLRLEPHKYFLLDIVSNSQNSIDVDKFDYLMRDSHNSGKSCGFDPQRLMFACRVIDGILCYQVKEVYNVYELFRTRYSMFRQVYSHRVSVAIQMMISDAMSLADPILSISAAVADPARFALFTDEILTVIRMSTDPGLAPARALLLRIERRDLYRCLLEAMCSETADEAVLDANRIRRALSTYRGGSRPIRWEDVRVEVLKLSYSAGKRNPVDRVLFFDNEFPGRSFVVPKDRVSVMLPSVFCEFYVRVFTTDANDMALTAAIHVAAQNTLRELGLTTPAPSAPSPRNRIIS
jgi:HD superfamily phosphohydrolase